MNGTVETKPARSGIVKAPDVNKKILVVDDESAILQTLRFNLERSGYAVVTASDGRNAIVTAQREQPDLVPRLGNRQVGRYPGARDPRRATAQRADRPQRRPGYQPDRPGESEEQHRREDRQGPRHHVQRPG